MYVGEKRKKGRTLLCVCVCVCVCAGVERVGENAIATVEELSMMRMRWTESWNAVLAYILRMCMYICIYVLCMYM